MIKKIARKFLQLVLLGYEKIKPTHGVVTLLYHKTTNTNRTPSIVNIDLETFEKQMKYLQKKGYHTLTIDEIYSYLYKGVRPKEKAIIITFDDGYKDNVEAYKILNKYGFSAICFLATGFIGKSFDYMPFWYEKGKMNYDISTVKNQQFEFLGVEEIKEAVDLGIEFAPHTEHHVDVSKIEEKCVAKELQDSMRTVEELTGKKQICFSYPFGLFNEFSRRVLMDSGIELSFAVYPGVLNEFTDPFFIPRHNVPREWMLFKLILTDKYINYMKFSNRVNNKYHGGQK